MRIGIDARPQTSAELRTRLRPAKRDFASFVLTNICIVLIILIKGL